MGVFDLISQICEANENFQNFLFCQFISRFILSLKMMITFGNEELLADGREKLPRIIDIARPTRELAISTVTAVNQGANNAEGDNGAHVHIAMPGNPAQIGLLEPKPATIMKLLATDPESMSIKARPTQRLQLLALNVIVDQVLKRSEMGFESDIAKAIADLVDKTTSSREEEVEGGGEEAENPDHQLFSDPRAHNRPQPSLLHYLLRPLRGNSDGDRRRGHQLPRKAHPRR